MRKTKRVSPELTRRSFLAATAGAVAAGSLAGCASGNTVGEEGESVSLAGTRPKSLKKYTSAVVWATVRAGDAPSTLPSAKGKRPI